MSKTIAIEITRYEELAAKEARLKLLENAVLSLPYSAQVESIKDIFDIRNPVKPIFEGVESNE